MIVAIRSAMPGDINALGRIDNALPAEGLRAEHLRQWVEADQCYLATAGEEIAGYGVLTHHFFHSGFVELLMVGSAFRRRGIGTALLRHMAGACRSPLLWTSTNRSNLPMQRLLAAEGFLLSGSVEGLDEGDPELFYRRRAAASAVPRPN